jgi:hypothetical protein
MSEPVEVFDEDQRKKLSVWAVNEPIADAEASDCWRTNLWQK